MGHKERVVLLHGLSRSALSMAPMARFLGKHGYETACIGYPSRSRPAEELVKIITGKIEAAGLARAEKVHFVTHSAGGIMARAFLASNPGFPVGRVVMLGPPNQGSRIASLAVQYAPARAFMGPLLKDLSRTPASFTALLPEPHYPVGVIAGDKKMIYLLSWLLEGGNDGVVTLEETKLPGMADFLVIKRGHTFIMNSRAAQRATLAFLKTGRFSL